MCGIAGFLDKTRRPDVPIGRHLLQMMRALGGRGPDSAGVALWSQSQNDALVLRITANGSQTVRGAATRDGDDAICRRVEEVAPIRERTTNGAYLRLVVDAEADLSRIAQAIENGANGQAPELVSAGRQLEIIKQVGTPDNLEETYSVSQMRGTHGIGHTRLSTESRIDLSHSQPFWAHGLPDLAVVHNGHITNYHKLRGFYEDRGVHFYTDNDSEVIGIFLRDRIGRGDTFEEALDASMIELDGSFCYLAATADQLAFAKDSYGFKPLVVAETDDWVAIATEEIALRRALGDDFVAREPAARRIKVWNLAGETAVVA